MVLGASDGLEVYGVFAAGGMATIQYARQNSSAGALDIVVKCLHPHFAEDPEFVKMLMDEAQLSLRIQHANVVRTLGMIERPQLGLVLEFVLGESLATLLALARAAGQPVPIPVATALVAGVLHGLHAAHETRADDGRPLNIVHRDVSPENILIGVDGIPRVLDFGIAKAVGRIRTTPTGELKGKLGYAAPEQLTAKEVTRRTDIYGAGVVLWETISGRWLFSAESEHETIAAVLAGRVASLHSLRADVPEALDTIVSRALAFDPEARYATAQDAARALECEVGVAPQSELVDWVADLAGERLCDRRLALQRMRQSSTAHEHGAQHRTVVLPERNDAAAQGVAYAVTAKQSQRGRPLWLAVLVVTGLMLASAAVIVERLSRGAAPSAPVVTPSAVSDPVKPLEAKTVSISAEIEPVQPARAPRAAQNRRSREPNKLQPAAPARPQFVPTGPADCYETVLEEGKPAQTPKAACLRGSAR